MRLRFENEMIYLYWVSNKHIKNAYSNCVFEFVDSCSFYVCDAFNKKGALEDGGKCGSVKAKWAWLM